MLVWLSVWSKVQIVCIWSSWCHCHPKIPYLLPHLNPDWFTFLAPASQVIVEKRPLNGCRSFINLKLEHTHTHPFNGLLSGITQVSRYQIWILLKQEVVSGSGISWATCKSAPHSRQITTPAPHHSVFYEPDALPAAQPTASKHWRQMHWSTFRGRQKVQKNFSSRRQLLQCVSWPDEIEMLLVAHLCLQHMSQSVLDVDDVLAVEQRQVDNYQYAVHVTTTSTVDSRRIQQYSVWARSIYTDLIDTQRHSSMRLNSGCLQPTQLSWLPMLSSVAPPSLRRKAATDNMLQIIKASPNWHVYADVFEPVPPLLASRRPIWSDMTSVNTVTQWREDWSSASVVNHTIVTDPTIWQTARFRSPLSKPTWSPMNRFRTGQGPCRANLHKWGLARSSSCDCGQRQTMKHIVDKCLLTKFDGGLNLLHEADDDASYGWNLQRLRHSRNNNNRPAWHVAPL